MPELTTSQSAHPIRVARPRSGRRRRRAEIAQPPLGSLTQRQHRHPGSCIACGSIHVTLLSMSLTDGTPVDFTSCHHCEHRRWEHAGSPVTVDRVLASTRKA